MVMLSQILKVLGKYYRTCNAKYFQEKREQLLQRELEIKKEKEQRLLEQQRLQQEQQRLQQEQRLQQQEQQRIQVEQQWLQQQEQIQQDLRQQEQQRLQYQEQQRSTHQEIRSDASRPHRVFILTLLRVFVLILSFFLAKGIDDQSFELIGIRQSYVCLWLTLMTKRYLQCQFHNQQLPLLIHPTQLILLYLLARSNLLSKPLSLLKPYKYALKLTIIAQNPIQM